MSKFTDKVTELKKNIDGKRLESFEKEVNEALPEILSDLKRKVEKNEKKLKEIMSKKTDFFFNVDEKQLDVNNREKYVQKFTEDLINFEYSVPVFDKKTISQLREEIEDDKNRIVMIEDTIKFIEETIKNISSEK